MHLARIILFVETRALKPIKMNWPLQKHSEILFHESCSGLVRNDLARPRQKRSMKLLKLLSGRTNYNFLIQALTEIFFSYVTEFTVKYYYFVTENRVYFLYIILFHFCLLFDRGLAIFPMRRTALSHRYPNSLVPHYTSVTSA